MISVDLSHSATNHTERVIAVLARSGWRPIIIPSEGKLQRNHQLLELRAPSTVVRARLCVFSVGDRGESHRRDERRVQITTTYLSGLPRLRGFADIVIGYDSQNDVYVGLDPRRLQFGGQKHNASSYVDPVALEHATTKTIAVSPHDSQLLGLEYQAIFKPPRLTEYIFNFDSIHKGLYVGNGSFSQNSHFATHSNGALRVLPENAHGELLVLERSSSPTAQQRPSKVRLSAYEKGNWKVLADVSPQELEVIRRKWCEIGDKGEYFAFQYEKQRLRKAGKDSLANRVEWISRRAVGKGYDIMSYEVDGSPRYIEVKSTNGSGMTFLMSDYEWRVAIRERHAYYIYRVIKADSTPFVERIIQDPVASENQRALERIPSGWKITIR